MSCSFAPMTIPVSDALALPVDRRVFPAARRLHRALPPSVEQAHLLPLDLDGDRRLEHALLWGPQGLDEQALGALAAADGPLGLAIVAAGEACALRGRGLQGVLGPERGARTWRSATPYLLPRRSAGPRGPEGVAAHLQAELAQRGLPRAEVQSLPAERELSFRHFVLTDGGERPPEGLTYALELTFETPIQGPLCLGYGQRYGLGRFEAAPEPVEPR